MGRISRFGVVGYVVGALLATLTLVAPVAFGQAPAARAVEGNPTASAIQRGVEWLYAQQKPDGTWETEPMPWAGAEKIQNSGNGQWGGNTALATYALLAAGESAQDPRIQKAIAFLAEADIRGVYALGLRGQIWQYLPPTSMRVQLAKRDRKLLMDAAARMQDRPIFGKFHYLVTADRSYDNSVSQYGVLGVWGAALAGAEVPAGFWKVIETAWLKDQHPSGAWSYAPGRDETFTMTSAGVATLFVTQDYLHLGRGARCDGNASHPALDAGVKWLSDNFDKVTTNRAYYALYGVERIGVASGMKYFGTHDWYDFGVQYLLGKQNKQNGNWGKLSDTSFALIFLSRGSAPVVINKLQYEQTDGKSSQPGRWNQRPRDAANLVHWIGNQIERPLNWQIVNLKVAAKDLHDAPILYISGDKALSLSPEDEQKLKAYVEQGGLIVGNPDCGDRAFSIGFRDLGKRLFDTEFRELPDDHLLYNIHFKRAQMRKKPRWQAMGNGAREMMVLLSDDSARNWQTRTVGGNETDFQMMLNLVRYAVDSNGYLSKGETYIVTPDARATAKRTLKLARAEFEGTWNPEPGGWNRMKAVMLNKHSVGLEVSTIKLGEAAIPDDVQVVHLTGTGRMNLGTAALEALQQFIGRGGMLVIDAAGGDSEFATDAEKLVKMQWPLEAKQLEQPIGPDHALLSQGGRKMPAVRYRGQVSARPGSPNLRVMEMQNRPAVVYSREDLSVGLVGMPIAGVAGYAPESATVLMEHILLHAAK